MMHMDQRKEQFSFAHVRAVAAAAGFGVSRPSVDDDSIDLTVASRSVVGTVKLPRLDLQAKCTSASPLDSDEFSFALKVKNYNDLRDPDILVPRILVVVRVPEEPSGWTHVTDPQLTIRYCGYWTSLRGKEETENKETVSVILRRRDRLTSQSLAKIMARIGEGENP